MIRFKYLCDLTLIIVIKEDKFCYA